MVYKIRVYIVQVLKVPTGIATLKGDASANIILLLEIAAQYLKKNKFW